MAEMLGKIEVLDDPLSLAGQVAEWMTQAALSSSGPFRVSLSGGSTPKTLYSLLASPEFKDRFPGVAFCGFGEMNVLFHKIIPRVITK